MTPCESVVKKIMGEPYAGNPQVRFEEEGGNPTFTLRYVDGLSMYLGYFGARGMDPMGQYEIEFSDDVLVPKHAGHGNVAWVLNEKVNGKKLRGFSNKEKKKISLVQNHYIKTIPLISDLLNKLIKEVDVCGCDDIKKDLEKIKEILVRMLIKLKGRDKLKLTLIGNDRVEAYSEFSFIKKFLGIESNITKAGNEFELFIGVSKDKNGEPYLPLFYTDVGLIKTLIHEISHPYTADHRSLDKNGNEIFKTFSTSSFEELFTYPKEFLAGLINSKDAKKCKLPLDKVYSKLEKDFNDFYKNETEPFILELMKVKEEN